MAEPQKSPSRRVAVHEVVWPDGRRWALAVVVLQGGLVTDCYPFKHEPPLTEWLGGTVTIEETAQGMVAFRNGQRLL